MNNNEIKLKVKKINIVTVVVYCLLAILFYFVGGEQLQYRNVVIDNAAPVQVIGEITNDVFVQQKFISEVDDINEFQIIFATFGRENTDIIDIKLRDNETQELLLEKSYDTATILNDTYLTVNAETPIRGVKGKELSIEISSQTGKAGNAVTIWSSTEESIDNSELFINNQKVDGSLCIKVIGKERLLFGQYYFGIVGIVGAIIIAYFFNLLYRLKTGKPSKGINVIIEYTRYKFLLNQLIARDFKTKYKRSVLGVLWSFLNPLLTMLVQYIVFSTLFKSDIENFPVYLLSGIIIFSFFQESTSVALGSIVGNASLITKVYVPKYIYTVAGVLSSMINMLLSLIPLFVVILLTGTKITKAYLLLPFGIICTLIFCIGLGFILASVMVFFRDTQFLWGIITMLWMYLTPIFYPINIIPASLMPVYKLNPLYHFIRFNRAIILDGVSPEPKAYLLCIVFAVGTFVIGATVFKKTQDKFVLNI